MEVKVKLRHLRIAPRKVRLVLNLIKGLSVEEAQQQLMFLKKKSATPVLKLLKSALANAENNFKLDVKTLKVKDVRADEGFTLKRWLPRAHGRATSLRKRATHVTLVLEGKTKEVKKEAKKEKK